MTTTSVNSVSTGVPSWKCYQNSHVEHARRLRLIKLLNMCEHLIELDHELKAKGIRETYRGQAWSAHCREWVYYDCVLDLEKLRKRYEFPSFIQTHINDDNKSGMEAGFVCDLCHDGVIGVHPHFGQAKKIVE